MKALRMLAATVAAWATVLVAQATPPPPARLFVSAEQGQAFSMALDGQALTWPVARQVRTGLLLPGWHRADVSLPAPFGPPVRFSTPVWLEAGRDNGYVLVLRRSGPQLLPVVPAAAPGYPGGGQYPPASPGYPRGGAYPGPSGPAYPTTPAPGSYPGGNGYPGGDGYPGNGGYSTPGGSNPAAPSPNGSFPDSNGGYPRPGGTGYPGSGSYPAQPPVGGNYPGGNYPDSEGGYPDSGSYLQPLAPAEVARLQQSISQRPFDDDRLSIIKQALSSSTVRADELTALVRTLSFDRPRIDLATYGYAHVSDQQNFYRVYEALQFSSSVREVQQALGLPR